jgi:glycosyltransferase involved in cell wall biosynthesis
MVIKPSICIISPNAYGMISGGHSGFIGGVEKLNALTARWFAQNDYKVTMLTWDEGGPYEEWFDKVRVLKICRQNEGISGLRFFHPKWTGLLKAMRQANADIYYQSCAESETGQVALWCRFKKRSFVYSVASDMDCDRKLPELKLLRERLLYRYGLRNAKRVIVQTNRQKDQMYRCFGIESCLIRMPCAGATIKEYIPRSKPPSRRVLWLARICRIKRPDRLLEIAAACPDVVFDLVGPVAEDAFSQEIFNRAKSLPNIMVHGRVSKEQIIDFYKNTALLLSTSDYEGFPNTFLEAWSFGVPVVSLFDPDGLISNYKLGIAASDIGCLIGGIKQLLADKDLYTINSEKTRHYFLTNHSVDKVMPQLAAIFCSATSIKAASQ